MAQAPGINGSLPKNPPPDSSSSPVGARPKANALLEVPTDFTSAEEIDPNPADPLGAAPDPPVPNAVEPKPGDLHPPRPVMRFPQGTLGLVGSGAVCESPWTKLRVPAQAVLSVKPTPSRTGNGDPEITRQVSCEETTIRSTKQKHYAFYEQHSWTEDQILEDTTPEMAAQGGGRVLDRAPDDMNASTKGRFKARFAEAARIALDTGAEVGIARLPHVTLAEAVMDVPAIINQTVHRAPDPAALPSERLIHGPLRKATAEVVDHLGGNKITPEALAAKLKAKNKPPL